MELHEGSLLHWLFTKGILPWWVPEAVPFSVLVIVLLVVVSLLATRNMAKVPNGLQNFVEWAVEGLENFTSDTIGPDGRKYTAFIGTFFLYIVLMNLLGSVPTMMSPTTSLNTTVALALCAIVTVHFLAIRQNGIVHWLQHFVGEPIWLAPLLVPLHIVGELARPISLSLRLFGNIFGEETVVAILAGFSPILLRIAGVPLLALPVQLPMLLFEIFTDLLQALVFCMLVGIYIQVTVGGHAPEHGHTVDEEKEYEFEHMADGLTA